MRSMSTALSDLGLTIPVVTAPMAGGPTTPALVVAAASAGSVGFLAGGYRTAQGLAEQTAAVRAATIPFGVNLFAPNPTPVDPDAFRRYAATIQAEADRYGLALAAEPVEDDDHWADKIDLLLADPVPAVSFTFGIPEGSVIAALRKAGSITIQTVTSAEEARAAAEAGVDALAVQAAAAGGHSGTLTPQHFPAEIPITELIAKVRGAVTLPLIAAGGLATAADITAVLRAGATAAAVGTVLLRTNESGASATHQAAVADPSRRGTTLTRAFSGRPARGLRNTFIDRYDTLAPLGYPALHHLTSPLRKAAAAAGDPELVNLWAGTGYRQATAEPAAVVLRRLAEST
jgi:NAD(P)H-dependent flavin oxidoreductase YrpB (nitropropane dioxygenase family)